MARTRQVSTASRPQDPRPTGMIIAFVVIAVLALASTFFGVLFPWVDATYGKSLPDLALPIGTIAGIASAGIGLTAIAVLMFAIVPYRMLAKIIAVANSMWVLLSFLILSSMGERFSPYQLFLPSLAALWVIGLWLLLNSSRSRLWPTR